MNLITVILILLVAGFAAFMIQTAKAIDPWFKNLIVGVIIFAVLVLLLNGFGFDTRLHVK